MWYLFINIKYVNFSSKIIMGSPIDFQKKKNKWKKDI